MASVITFDIMMYYPMYIRSQRAWLHRENLCSMPTDYNQYVQTVYLIVGLKQFVKALKFKKNHSDYVTEVLHFKCHILTEIFT